jgi:enoyl-CoA hydratase/carnithine racemase
MGTWSNIVTERIASLGLVTLNRPESRNPLDRTTATELLEAFTDFFEDPQIRSVAVTVAGAACCAGGDLRQMERFSQMPAAEAFDWPRPII